MRVDYEAVLRFDRELHQAGTLDQLMTIMRDAVARALGYQNVWMSSFEAGPPEVLRLVASAGPRVEVMKALPPIPVAGDGLIPELLTATRPVVIVDARLDPRPSPAAVEFLQFRTIINVPITIGEQRVAVLGTGSFGEEGPRAPTEAELELLTVMVTQVGGAFQRLRRAEERARFEAERARMLRSLASVQRLESLALLAGGVAHDFNNLLTVMTANLRLVEEGPLEPHQREDLSEALEVTSRAAQLAQQLLAVGRQQALELGPVDLNARLGPLLRLVQRALGSAITLRLETQEHLAPVLGDGGQLDQVVMNLCLNARDAMPDGGRLTLETREVVLNGAFIAAHPWARTGRFVELTVSDTGRGMTPEVLERVFEPFFTTKAPGAGTGLGLACAKGIIEQHHGMLHAYSEPGVGTRFKIYLPVHGPPAAAQEGAPPIAPRPGLERILVAEDDLSIREQTRALLARAGYTVVTAATGKEAVELATATPFELVVLDGVMPELSGPEAHARIRAVRPETRILYVSGYGEALLGEGRTARPLVLSKPLDPDGLLRAVREALDSGRS